ncbi:hypothetical protein BDY21DRAFT_115168 [Lineolata rhizophorae]|uniref:Uncharacterized protein n=1 Tax=Lineolata rhizophorae TaxID=578093 RepID=A0A6A6NRJ6_9PEZI|nr:hypothetical protein BDY21DRAFT_115168 [Lineolata rhizophorae]
MCGTFPFAESYGVDYYKVTYPAMSRKVYPFGLPAISSLYAGHSARLPIPMLSNSLPIMQRWDAGPVGKGFLAIPQAFYDSVLLGYGLRCRSTNRFSGAQILFNAFRWPPRSPSTDRTILKTSTHHESAGPACPACPTTEAGRKERVNIVSALVTAYIVVAVLAVLLVITLSSNRKQRQKTAGYWSIHELLMLNASLRRRCHSVNGRFPGIQTGFTQGNRIAHVAIWKRPQNYAR